MRCGLCFKSTYSTTFLKTMGCPQRKPWHLRLFEIWPLLAHLVFCITAPSVHPCLPTGLSDQQLLPAPCSFPLWALLVLLPLQGPHPRSAPGPPPPTAHMQHESALRLSSHLGENFLTLSSTLEFTAPSLVPVLSPSKFLARSPHDFIVLSCSHDHLHHSAVRAQARPNLNSLFCSVLSTVP